MFRPLADIIRGLQPLSNYLYYLPYMSFYYVSQGLSNVKTEYSLKDWLLIFCFNI
jgi:hypothetical protein